MGFTEDRIINSLREIVEIFHRKYYDRNGIFLDYIVLIDTSYNNDNVAHSVGFILKTEQLLLCCIEVDLMRMSSFSDKLVKFLLAHELCHSLYKQLDGSAELAFGSLVTTSKGLGTNNVVLIKGASTAKDIRDLLCDLRSEQFGLVLGEHKCIDLWAKALLNLSDDDTKQCIEELYNYSNKNQDITTRLNAAKDQNYKGCLEMI